MWKSGGIRIALALFAGLCLMAVNAQAETIIADTFDGSWYNIVTGDGGKKPNIPNLDSVRWVGEPGDGGDCWSIDQSELIYNNAYGHDWYGNRRDLVRVPFEPETGMIYEFSFDVKPTSGAYMFLNLTSDTESGWLDCWDSAYNVHRFVQASDAGNGVGNWSHMSVVLDTTQEQWTVSDFLNGEQVGSTYTYTTNPTIHKVGIGGSLADVTYDNFLVTKTVAAVPEPSTLVLLASFGLVALIGYVRRRK